MTNDKLPACKHCSGTEWTLQCRMQVLLYAFSEDPDGPFKRECTVDRVRDLLVWCNDCGEEAHAAAAQVLTDTYRSHDPERFFDPTQGGLLAQPDDWKPDDVVQLVLAPILVGPTLAP